MKAYKILTVGMFALLVTACNSFLDVVPDNRTELDSPEAIKELLVSAYPKAHYYHMCEVMSDNVAERLVSGTHSRATLNKQMYQWMDGTGTGTDYPVYVWTNYYEAIAAANLALEAVEEEGDTKEYAAIKGEALVCRAFCHFILVNLFAEHYDPDKAEQMLGIPYCVKPETQAIGYYKRDNFKQVYDQIEEHLQTGLPLLQDQTYEVPKYHFAKAAAHAFAARFYQYKGEWDSVIVHSTAALGSNPKSKLRDLRNPDQANGQWGDKDAYAAKYFKVTQPSPFLMISAKSWWARDGQSFSLCYSMKKDEHASLFTEKNVTGSPVTGTYATFFVISTNSAGCARMYKFDELFIRSSIGSSSGQGYTVSTLLSSEEALLNRAEAYVMKNQFDLALEDINLYLAERVRVDKDDPHADFTPYKVNLAKIKAFYDGKEEFPDFEPFYASTISEDQMSMLKCVVDWRRKEFMQEGLRWFDIKRFHLPVVHTFTVSGDPSITLTKDDLRRAVQIPSEAQAFGVEANPR